MIKKKGLVVGNCKFDGPNIVNFIKMIVKANAKEAKTIDIAKEILTDKKYDLVTVNRIGNEDNLNGLNLIDWIQNNKKETPIMLITNFSEKMAEAEEHGAVHGFGKSELHSKKTKILLEKYLK